MSRAKDTAFFSGWGLLPLLAIACLTSSASPAAGADPAVFVEDGKAKDVKVVGKKWKAGSGYLECSGTHNYLYAGKGLGAGDLHVKARLALLKVKGSAASFDLDASHFGFDGGGGQGMFVSGPVFGKLRFIGKWPDFLTEGKPFDLEVIRKGTKLTFLIDGKQASTWTDRRKRFGAIALRPWRATMRVYSFSATGTLEKLVIPRTGPTGKVEPFPIPVIDLSNDAARRVVIAQA